LLRFAPMIKKYVHLETFNLVMGLGQKFLTWVKPIFCCLGCDWVSHLWFGFGKNSPKTTKFFNFFPFKKISPGQIKKYLGQRWVGLLFTGGQKYARVGSGQGPSLL